MAPKLGFSLQKQYDRPMEQVIELLHRAGFSAVSVPYTTEADLSAIADCVQTRNMTIQSLHAPNRVAPLWKENQNLSTPVFNDIITCVDLCAKFQIPVLVVHSWNGLIYTFPKNLYFENFDRIVEYALERNVSVAFENLEGEEYLDALMARYRGFSHVGFCWDSGHEHCYPHKLDFMKLFGDRLIMTHLNDNLGPRDPSGIPTGVDDLHYLPGDGNIDWTEIIAKLKDAKHQDILNFELKIQSISKSESDMIYTKLSLEEFLQAAAARCQHFAEQYA